MSTTPTPSAAPVFDAALKVKQVEEFYGNFAGKQGYNPYFYLHQVKFFDIKKQVDAKQTLSPEHLGLLQSIKLDEQLAKVSNQMAHDDLYRVIKLPQSAAVPVLQSPAK